MAKKTGKNLVIVESPAKAKTINKYLGSDFVVKASMGHVRDMPRSGLQVDLKTFQPTYTVLPEKTKVITELKKLAKDAPEIYLATDLDREGEAIAWHLQEALGIPDSQVKRVIFNAITKSEIQKAFSNPHPINMHRVNAQQARRVLDRLVGYEISPVLWRKVARGLSAGRVQSVAVRLVVEREREIEAFVPNEYWKIGAVFTTDGGGAAKLASEWGSFLKGEPGKADKDKFLSEHDAFTAELQEFNGQRFEPKNIKQAREAAEALGYVVSKEEIGNDPNAKGPAQHPSQLVGSLGNAQPKFVVESVEKKRTTSRPPGPFITSTLQQGAASRLGMGAQRTMRIAQTLYEQGYITYMRTDSTHLSGEALSMVRGYIPKEFGPRYLPEKPNFYSSSNKGAQEAHEAIRPTDVTFNPSAAKAKLGADEFRLYQLIWNRFVACQMTHAEFDQTTALIGASTKAGKAVFKATGRKLVFDGFMKVAGVSSEDQLLPELAQSNPVFPIDLNPSQHFTQPPARYTEASLVKKLEEEGIGRPSTYAAIIQTIQDREYVTQVDRRFHATQLGMVVTDKLVQAFPEIMDVKFTAGMEGELDKVEEQQADWVKLLREFYGPFHSSVDKSLEKIEHAGGALSQYKCPKCGKGMLYRISKNGFFLACEDRECATTQPVDFAGKPQLREKSEIKCPKCGREMLKRSGRFGEFLSCTGYSVKDEKGEPSCKMILNLDKEGNPQPPKVAIETSVPCEKCGSPMKLRNSKRGPFLGCSAFPKCRATRQVAKIEGPTREYLDKLIPLLNESSAESAKLAAAVSSQFAGQLPEGAAAAKSLDNAPTDIDCDSCGKPMRIKKGKRGYFLGCSGYPKCKNTGEVPARLVEELGIGEARPEDKKATKGKKSGEDDSLDDVELSIE